MAREKFVQIESKNALLELISEGRTFTKIYIASNAYKDPKTEEIVAMAGKKRIPMEKLSRRAISSFVRTGNTESVVGIMVADNMWTLKDLLKKTYDDGKQPFFLILDHVKYDLNIANILRTAFASGVNGVITPIDIKNFMTNETIRISMGTSLRVPIVEMNLFSAMKELKKADIKIIGLEMDGETYYESDLRGPVAFVLGAEDTGISTRVHEKLDGVISIPMREGIGSLNVSSSAAVIMYEKLKQEVTA